MRTLIATVGQTPQVVTGALHSLLTQARPWIPDRIILATTKLNESRLLFGDDKTVGQALLGARGRLREVYVATGHSDSFVEPGVRLAQSTSGQQIDDVRTPEDVSAFANLLLGLVRDATEEAQSELHLCLAGGRKSVSFLAGQVMSLYGRPQDVLSHVLVAPSEFEDLNSFWHPAQPDTIVHPKTGKGIDPASAEVALHHVPFIRLRAYLPRDEAFLWGSAPSYEAAVDRASEALAVDRLVVDFPNRCIRVGAHKIKADLKEIAAAATIAYCARSGIAVSQKTFEQAMSETTSETFMSVWSSLRVISLVLNSSARANELREEPSLFEQRRRNTEKQFVYNSDFGEPVSRLRGRARDALAPALAKKLFVPKEIRTDFDANNIEILLPAEAALFPLSPGLASLSIGSRRRSD